MGYTKHDYQSNDILYAADLAEMDNQIYKNEQDILKLEENKQPAGNYASTEEVSQLRSDLKKKADSIELERVASEVETLKENEVTAEDIANLGFWKEEDGKNYIDSETSKSVNIALEEAKASGEFDGAEGPQGPKGDTGEQGPRGETGATGAKGDKGDKGDTGASGKDGKDGTSVTVSSVSESNDDGGSNVVTFSDGKTMTIKNGSKGSTGAKGEKGDRGEKGETGSSGAKGADGYTPQKNVDYFDGKDGVSATHSWNGTVLTITSASGSSSADLKGSDGKDGTDGVSGKDGVSVTHKWNGTTLTVTSASGTSSADLKGDKGDTGATGKTAYEYAQDGGYAGTETAFAEKLAQNTYSKTEVDTKFTQVNTALDDLETDVTNVKSDLAKKNSYVVQDTEPEDTSVLWVDPNDEFDDGFQELINLALAQAKASGEFDGDDGKTPVKGEDYFTEAEKAEMVNAVLTSLPVYSGEVV